jgi:hypothetical protein
MMSGNHEAPHNENFLHFPVTCSLLGPDIFVSTLLPQPYALPIILPTMFHAHMKQHTFIKVWTKYSLSV